MSTAIQTISTFLSASINTETGLPLVERLHNGIPTTWTSPQPNLKPQTEVTLYSLELLRTVHGAVKAEKWELGIKDWRQVNALVEIIIVLGVYKSLAPGVGLPESRRIQSVMLAKEGQKDDLPLNERKLILETFVVQMKTIIEEGGDVGENFRRRFNVDILSGMVDLAFNPAYSEAERNSWKAQYNQHLSSLPLSAILSSLTVFLHPKTPPWLRTPLTRQLSSIPLQADRHGVRTIILFLLGKQQDPSISQLDHIGKVIGSIPTWITAEEYIQRIAVQVIELLDEKDVLLQRAAAHIITQLMTKHEAFVARYIFDLIQEPLLPRPSDSMMNDVVFEDTAVEICLNRLEKITLNPAPPLVISLLQPILPNLFLFLAYTQTAPQSLLKSKILNLIQTYLTASPTPLKDVLSLIERMLYVPPDWTFGPGGHGGVAVRRISTAETLDLNSIQSRIENLLEILEKTSENTKSEIFVGIVRKWLSSQDEMDPMQTLVNVQLLQEILTRYENELLKSPINVIQVCEEILSSYLSKSKSQSNRSILSILPEAPEEDEGDELVDMALNLLSTITAESIQREITPEEISILTSCLPHLQQISTTDKDPSRRNTARNVISFIRARIAMTQPNEEPTTQSDEQLYEMAQTYITDPLVPVRAQGLSILRDLILQRSSAINVDIVLGQLIGMLQDDDSYVYLNAIKSIQTLADIHGRQISQKLITESSSRSNIDEKLRITETLAGVIRRMGETFTGDFAREVISHYIQVVSQEKEWRIRVSAIGLLSVAVEICPSEAGAAIEMALHLFKVNDLLFTEEGEGAAPLRRGAVAVIAGVLRGGGIDALGGYTRDVLRSIRYLARSDSDETVKQLAQGVMEMLSGVIETAAEENRWTIRPKIQEL